jgi:hypothetical protein
LILKTRPNEKFISAGQRWMIFTGIVWPCFAGLALTGEPLLRVLGDNIGIYIILGIFMAIFATAMVLYDRLPDRFIIPVGVIGWILTIILAMGLVLWAYSGVFKVLKL